MQCVHSLELPEWYGKPNEKQDLPDIEELLKKFCNQVGDDLICVRNNCGFSCDIVQKMIRHIQWHMKFRPFACPFCKYVAARKDHVEKHVKRKHADEDLGENSFAIIENRVTEALVPQNATDAAATNSIDEGIANTE